MRESSWIIQGALNAINKYPYKREAERGLTQAEKAV